MINLIKILENIHTGVYVIMNPNEPISLKGKNAKAFDEYQKKGCKRRDSIF